MTDDKWIKRVGKWEKRKVEGMWTKWRWTGEDRFYIKLGSHKAYYTDEVKYYYATLLLKGISSPRLGMFHGDSYNKIVRKVDRWISKHKTEKKLREYWIENKVIIPKKWNERGNWKGIIVD